MSTAIAKNFQIGADSTPSNNFTLYQPASPDGTLRLGNGNTGTTSNLLTIDSSGDVGIGVVPSAWTSSFKALQIGAQGGLSATSTGTFLSANWYTDGTNRYIGTGNATLYQQISGAHAFYTAGSGTAGNAITFTQAMTLDVNGNLTLGATANYGYRLHLENATGNMLVLNNSASTGNGTANVTIDAFENGIGYHNVFLNGFEVNFRTGGAQNLAAKIDSSGNLLVGTTTAHGKLGCESSANARNIFGFSTISSSFSDAIFVAEFRNYSPNNTTARFLYCGDTTTDRLQIRSNGGIVNYAGNNVNISDRREKINFAPAKSYLETICSIPVQTFNYIDQNMEEDPGLTLGVVAQDVQAVAPELVMESNWGTEENPKMRLSIYQTDLQYALMKAIQELNAKLEAQAAEIAALKGTA